jgi:RNA polymerase sigma-70 factor (ECF subfamily)
MPLIDSLRGRRAALRALGDEELMALVVRQDAAAFEVIFDRHGAATYSLAYRMCGERELAEDVVQETFTSMWRGVGSYQASRGSLRSWLLAATRNRMIDAFRTRTSKQAGDVPDDGLAEILPSDADTLGEVSAREEAGAVHAALGTLPPEQRRVIELAFFGGLSHSEIAARLGLPAGTVKGRMRLGLDKLRVSLGTQAGSVL